MPVRFLVQMKHSLHLYLVALAQNLLEHRDACTHMDKGLIRSEQLNRGSTHWLLRLLQKSLPSVFQRCRAMVLELRRCEVACARVAILEPVNLDPY